MNGSRVDTQPANAADNSRTITFNFIHPPHSAWRRNPIWPANGMASEMVEQTAARGVPSYPPEAPLASRFAGLGPYLRLLATRDAKHP